MNEMTNDEGSLAAGQDPTQTSPAPEEPTTSGDVDYDSDGDLDGFWTALGDGTIAVVLDVDDDEVPDFVQLDTNADGIVDVIATPQDGGYVFSRDADGDGQFEEEVFVSREELAADVPELLGVLDAVWEPAVEGQPTDPAAPTPTDGVPEGTPTVVDGQVVGDPEGRKDLWFEQSFNGSCVPASIAQLVSFYTGEAMTDQDFIQFVNEQRAWSVGPDGVPGMTGVQAELVMDALGVPATFTGPSSVEQLTQFLAEDRAVLLFVDGYEIWGVEGAQENDQDQEMNHAVTITGIDLERQVVYLNDTGTPGGAALEVPLSLFEDAWADSGNGIVVCDETAVEFRDRTGIPQETAADVVPAAGSSIPGIDDLTSTGPLDQLATFVRTHPVVLLPVVIGVAAIVRAATSK